MSLSLKLKPGEVVCINGAVLSNTSEFIIELTSLNQCEILKSRNVLPDTVFMTPVRRAYLETQMVLLGARPVLASDEAARTELEKLRAVFSKPEHIACLDGALAELNKGRIYQALRFLEDLVLLEAAMLGIRPPERMMPNIPESEDPTSFGHGPIDAMERVARRRVTANAIKRQHPYENGGPPRSDRRSGRGDPSPGAHGQLPFAHQDSRRRRHQPSGAKKS